MDGRLVVERGTIYDFLALALGDINGEKRSLPARILGKLRFLTRSFVSRNNPWRARRNVAHHYDLDHRLYELFLDPTSNTAAPTSSIQIARSRRPSSPRNALSPPSCSSSRTAASSIWGGLGLYIKQIGGARQVQGITLSSEQLEVARARAEKAGVADSVRFVLQDYREVEGTFDRIVSVGMFEHVGAAVLSGLLQQVPPAPEARRGHGAAHHRPHDGPWYPNPWLDK